MQNKLKNRAKISCLAYIDWRNHTISHTC